MYSLFSSKVVVRELFHEEPCCQNGCKIGLSLDRLSVVL